MPRVIQVIETEELRGNGTTSNPFRRIRTYWTMEGDQLGEARDPCPPAGPIVPTREQTIAIAALSAWVANNVLYQGGGTRVRDRVSLKLNDEKRRPIVSMCAKVDDYVSKAVALLGDQGVKE